MADTQEYDQRRDKPHADLPARRGRLCGMTDSSDRAV
jgi:hypothetical protein